MFYDDDFDETNSHLFPSSPSQKNESIVPVAEFFSRKLLVLQASFRTATDSDERQEIIQSALMISASLSLLSLGFFTEEQSLVQAAKVLFRGL